MSVVKMRPVPGYSYLWETIMWERFGKQMQRNVVRERTQKLLAKSRQLLAKVRGRGIVK